MPKPIVILDAPSNLGLRPPEPGLVPGVYKLAGALRDKGLVSRLRANDGGVVVPPRYLPAWDGKTLRNAQGLISYSLRLADRIQQHISAGAFPLVLGGDCSILLGGMLALRRRGRYGLIFIDGHLDFRHPGNAEGVGSAAGEDLALVMGRGAASLTNLEGHSPLVEGRDVVAIGFRPDDEYLAEVREAGVTTIDATQLQREGATQIARLARETLQQRSVEGYWIHLDVDVLDPIVMPAVDTPTPGGLTVRELVSLLRHLLTSNLALGLEVTVFDPDLDPDGMLAQRLTDVLAAGFQDYPSGQC
ncbi:arginase family protein [Tengunoibacter tsumagoiensis]|uniref:Arginase n=1 Tax=Tengunoibacter tsumagoiensis TaxID=2014871 RepID=A0A402A9D0_9CHLR|nr:arginase family protein [Tengunoibacter tsumagoiensis]GCE15606.1 arginase [Tengunoibacter tsumagoiensis]